MSQVTITKSQSIKSFQSDINAAGVKLAECTNKETGELFKSLAFVGDDGKVIKFAHFGASIKANQQNAEWLKANIDDIQIGLNSNNHYSAFINNGGWQSIL